MTNQLVIGTTNIAKINQLKSALGPFSYIVKEIAAINKIPEIAEDGKDAQENARKKATSYAQYLNETVLSMDIALYLDGLVPQDQPGVHVRRIGGFQKRASDDEALNYYQKLISTLGGEIGGHWEYAICIAKPSGEVYETTINSQRIFTENKGRKITKGYPLESIQIDPHTKKYISDMSSEEIDMFWKRNMGTQLQSFVGAVLHMK